MRRIRTQKRDCTLAWTDSRDLSQWNSTRLAAGTQRQEHYARRRASFCPISLSKPKIPLYGGVHIFSSYFIISSGYASTWCGPCNWWTDTEWDWFGWILEPAASLYLSVFVCTRSYTFQANLDDPLATNNWRTSLGEFIKLLADRYWWYDAYGWLGLVTVNDSNMYICIFMHYSLIFLAVKIIFLHSVDYFSHALALYAQSICYMNPVMCI